MIDRKNAQQMAEALVDKMTVDEMIGQLKFDAPAIERLHVPAYNWWNEGLHGVEGSMEWREQERLLCSHRQSVWRQPGIRK